jgi:hypothetical protein
MESRTKRRICVAIFRSKFTVDRNSVNVIHSQSYILHENDMIYYDPNQRIQNIRFGNTIFGELRNDMIEIECTFPRSRLHGRLRISRMIFLITAHVSVSEITAHNLSTDTRR